MNSKTVEENVDKFVKSYISPDFSFRKYQKEIICSIIEDIVIKIGLKTFNFLLL